MPFLIADANDKSSLTNLAAKTDVIIAVAGPYAKYGTNVVEASLEQGTHYCDITGEDQAQHQKVYCSPADAFTAVQTHWLLYL